MDLERFDIGELEQKLLQVATEIYGYDRFRPDTPMHEVRATAEQAGMMFGRMIAAALHSGPVTADIAHSISGSTSSKVRNGLWRRLSGC